MLTMPSFKSLRSRGDNFWLRPPAIAKFKYGREELRKLGREGSDVIQSRQQKQFGYLSMGQVSPETFLQLFFTNTIEIRTELVRA